MGRWRRWMWKVNLKAATAEVMTANRMKAAEERISLRSTQLQSIDDSLRSRSG